MRRGSSLVLGLGRVVVLVRRPLSALCLATGDLGRERVEARGPEIAEGMQPRVDLLQTRSIEAIDPRGAVASHGGESVLPKDAKVLRDCGLRDRVVAPDRVDQFARASVTARELLKNAAPNRVAEDIEGVHAPQPPGSDSGPAP